MPIKCLIGVLMLVVTLGGGVFAEDVREIRFYHSRAFFAMKTVFEPRRGCWREAGIQKSVGVLSV